MSKAKESKLKCRKRWGLKTDPCICKVMKPDHVRHQCWCGERYKPKVKK